MPQLFGEQNASLLITDYNNYRLVERTLPDLFYTTSVRSIPVNETFNFIDSDMKFIAANSTHLFVHEWNRDIMLKFAIPSLEYVGGTAEINQDVYRFYYGFGVDDTYLYIPDTYNSQIHRHLASDFSYVDSTGPYLNGDVDDMDYPMGVCSDGTHIYVTEGYTGCIYKIAIADMGGVLGEDNIPGPQAYHSTYYGFDWPTHICVSGDFIYVQDDWPYIVKMNSSNDLTELIRLGDYGYGVDNYFNPYGIVTDGTSVYISDWDGYFVVKRSCSDLSFEAFDGGYTLATLTSTPSVVSEVITSSVASLTGPVNPGDSISFAPSGATGTVLTAVPTDFVWVTDHYESGLVITYTPTSSPTYQAPGDAMTDSTTGTTGSAPGWPGCNITFTVNYTGLINGPFVLTVDDPGQDMWIEYQNGSDYDPQIISDTGTTLTIEGSSLPGSSYTSDTIGMATGGFILQDAANQFGTNFPDLKAGDLLTTSGFSDSIFNRTWEVEAVYTPNTIILVNPFSEWNPGEAAGNNVTIFFGGWVTQVNHWSDNRYYGGPANIALSGSRIYVTDVDAWGPYPDYINFPRIVQKSTSFVFESQMTEVTGVLPYVFGRPRTICRSGNNVFFITVNK